ncbi:MAG: DUF3883 domain-containing protein, partial [Bifidobacteriaceae bacterium]|nr:DUF3883 domain-containing protein [Bifidobacteriaceae bacterium]
NYLDRKITQYLGRREAVVTIHGGTPREARKQIRERFTSVPETIVLLATDAAGEGLNLQRAHLMVNYDLPWNPNRIEQRFGRIHRIGQQTVCHLWNMVAAETREGDVFQRLLGKIDQMGKAYNGSLFNVLGESQAFGDRSLGDLLIEAIRYGDQPQVRARLERTIDASVADGLEDLLKERALHPEMFPALNLEEVRRVMEAARERKLQPGYIRSFFIHAFERLGGRVRQRETGRWQVLRVPPKVQEQARRADRWAPIPDQYERITFETKYIRLDHTADAALIAPGHPLLQAVIELTAGELAGRLGAGTVFVDRREDQASEPSLLFALEQKIENLTPGGQRLTVDHHFDYVHVDRQGHITVTVAPPYLDFGAPALEEADGIGQILSQPWVTGVGEQTVRTWAYRESLQPRLDELSVRLEAEAARVRLQVSERLNLEISHWDREQIRLAESERAGRPGRMSSKAAHDKARALEERLDARMEELDQAVQLTALPARIRGCALVVPSRLLVPEAAASEVAQEARETAEVERRAVDAVLAAERSLGRDPEEMPHFNPGFDIRSTDADGDRFFIEVKGRIKGAATFTATANEIAFAQTQGERHRLALVSVDPDDPARDQVRYVVAPFAGFLLNPSTRSSNESWNEYWSKAGEPR